MSLKESSVFGGEELFIIGKNFLRGTKVFFQEVSEDENAGVLWEKESEIDRDYFQPVSIVIVFVHAFIRGMHFIFVDFIDV